MSIFRDNAPLYWQRGLPAIPLIRGEKRPAIARWQIYADKFPDEAEQASWLSQLGDGNIGMPMGAASNLVAIDIDTDDPAILTVLDAILPPSPWVRRGKKGRVQVYRYTGERTSRVKDTKSAMICEILSKGTQIVLPPSIHPDTKRPYEANCDLWNLATVPPLPPDFEKMLRSALLAAGIDVHDGSTRVNSTEFVAAGARDNQMVAVAGIEARGVVRGDRCLLEALDQIRAWVENYTQKVIGDEMSVDKAQAKLVEFLIRDVTGERKQALPLGWDEGLSADDKNRLGLNFTDDDVVWDYEQVKEYLQGEFTRWPDPASSGFLQAVSVVLDKLARSDGKTLNKIHEDSILHFIQAQSQNTLTKAGLTKQVALLKKGPIEGTDHTELAEELIKHHEPFGELRCHADEFWQWRGAYWQRTAPGDLLRTIALEFGRRGYVAARRASDHKQILEVARTLQSKELKGYGPKGLNFANGFLTENLELLPHHPDQGMTYILPHRYMPEIAGHMPMFNQFLHDCWGHDPDFMDKVAALQEAMGATLFSHAPTYQKAVLLYGKAHSGKSRIPALIQGLLPPNSCCSVPPQDWRDRFLPAQMFGRIFNFAGELSESKYIPGDAFKSVVSGEAMTGQNKNQPIFAFQPQCAHWFCSNFLPRTRDTSSGFSRRWLILQFTRAIPAGKRINDLEQQILETEAEAIIAWAVQGFVRLKEQGGYTLPSSHMAMVDEMDRSNNSVRYFLAASQDVETGVRGMTTLSQLHHLYTGFCIAMGIQNRVNSAEFERRMDEMLDDFGLQVEKGAATTCYHNVVIRPGVLI